MAPWLFVGALTIGVLHMLLPHGFYQRALRGRSGVMNAVLLGVPLPLCSCAVIPVAVGMRNGGAPKSATSAFFLSTPQTGADSILVTGGFLGWPFAAYRVAVAVVMGLTVGGLVGVVDDSEAATKSDGRDKEDRGFAEGLATWTSLESIWGWVLIGVLVSAAIGQLGPIGETVGVHDNPVLGCMAALVVAVPLYVCATASIPIAASLVAAGLPVEAALVFLIAGPATNTATIGAVYSCLGRSATGVYLGVTIVGSLAFAWLFKLALPTYTIDAKLHEHHDMSAWAVAMGVGFLGVTAVWMGMRLRQWFRASTVDNATVHQLKVDGMTCQGCVRRLQAALNENQATSGAVVELPPGRVYWTTDLDAEYVSQTVRECGFSIGVFQE